MLNTPQRNKRQKRFHGVNLAVIDMNLTWQAVTIVPQLNGLRVQRGKNFTGQAGKHSAEGTGQVRKAVKIQQPAHKELHPGRKSLSDDGRNGFEALAFILKRLLSQITTH